MTIRPHTREHWQEKQRQWAIQQQAVKQSRHMMAVIVGVIVLAVVLVSSIYIFSGDIGQGISGYLRQIGREFTAQPGK